MTNEHVNPNGGARTQQLEDAWELGVQGNYGDALLILERQLSIDPTDVCVLRLMGNLFEKKELFRLEHSSKKLTSSSDS